jgi:hypothetical protein
MPSLQNQTLLTKTWILSRQRCLRPEECCNRPYHPAHQPNLLHPVILSEAFHGGWFMESGTDLIFAPCTRLPVLLETGSIWSDTARN